MKNKEFAKLMLFVVIFVSSLVFFLREGEDGLTPYESFFKVKSTEVNDTIQTKFSTFQK